MVTCPVQGPPYNKWTTDDGRRRRTTDDGRRRRDGRRDGRTEDGRWRRDGRQDGRTNRGRRRRRRRRKNVENTFEVCSYIQKHTHNSNPIFKITIYCTKYTKHAKIHSNISKKKNGNRTLPTNQLLSYCLYKLHNSYVVFFVYFVDGKDFVTFIYSLLFFNILYISDILVNVGI